MTNIDKLKALDKCETASFRYAIAAIFASLALLGLLVTGTAQEMPWVFWTLLSAAAIFAGLSGWQNHKVMRLFEEIK